MLFPMPKRGNTIFGLQYKHRARRLSRTPPLGNMFQSNDCSRMHSLVCLDFCENLYLALPGFFPETLIPIQSSSASIRVAKGSELSRVSFFWGCSVSDTQNSLRILLSKVFEYDRLQSRVRPEFYVRWERQ